MAARKKPSAIAEIHVPSDLAKTLSKGDAFDVTFEGAHYAKAASVLTVSQREDEAHHARVTFAIVGKLGAELQKRFGDGDVSGVSIGPL